MEALALLHDWGFWQRPAQRWPDGDWHVWFINAGRGFGKTRTGAETVRAVVESGRAGRIALVAETAADARDVIVEGESGILACSPPWFRPKYEPSKRRLTWPNGAIATTYSGDDPEQLRGPQHGFALVDELAKYRYGQECWDNLMFGLRLGDDPRVVVTTTPRPIPLIRALLADPMTVVTGGSTYENVDNLAGPFRQRITRYEGTRLGRQELYAQILDDTPGALWTHGLFDQTRIGAPRFGDYERVVVGVDPGAGGPDGETGIVTGGKRGEHGDVLSDDTTGSDPAEWAPAVIRAFVRTRADKIVAERNNGGPMVEHVIRQTTVEIDGAVISGGNLPIELVWASRGKHTRAEPISMLWHQGRGHIVGAWPALEDQCCTWVPGEDSPDRMDAMVWALTDLFPNEAAALPPTAPAVGGARGQLAAGPMGRRA